MLDFHLGVQRDFLTWVHRGAIKIYDIPQEALDEIVGMMQHYTNVPMDLADATLMYVAHKTKIKQIVSIDSDFDIYRTLKQGMLTNLLR